jgi:recombinase-like protein
MNRERAAADDQHKRFYAMVTVDNKTLGFDPNEYDTNPVEVAYRNALADGLERVLDKGAESLADVVKGLNELSAFANDGSAWTEEKLAAELSRLGR